jgi:hypothetical protein
MLQGWFAIFDFDLYHGRVVHDYLADEADTDTDEAGGNQ